MKQFICWSGCVCPSVIWCGSDQWFYVWLWQVSWWAVILNATDCGRLWDSSCWLHWRYAHCSSDTLSSPSTPLSYEGSLAVFSSVCTTVCLFVCLSACPSISVSVWSLTVFFLPFVRRVLAAENEVEFFSSHVAGPYTSIHWIFSLTLLLGIIGFTFCLIFLSVHFLVFILLHEKN